MGSVFTFFSPIVAPITTACCLYKISLKCLNFGKYNFKRGINYLKGGEPNYNKEFFEPKISDEDVNFIDFQDVDVKKINIKKNKIEDVEKVIEEENNTGEKKDLKYFSVVDVKLINFEEGSNYCDFFYVMDVTYQVKTFSFEETSDKTIEELKKISEDDVKNGIERILVVVNGKKNIYKLTKKIEIKKKLKKKYNDFLNLNNLLISKFQNEWKLKFEFQRNNSNKSKIFEFFKNMIQCLMLSKNKFFIDNDINLFFFEK
jgi:hypothetical protein